MSARDLTVTGGSTGISASMDDMQRAAGVLSRSAADVGAVAGHAVRDGLSVLDLADELAAPVEFGRAEAAVVTATVRLGVVTAEVEAIAAALAAAATAYRGTESAIAGGWSLVRSNAAYAAGFATRVAIANVATAATVAALTPPGQVTIAAAAWWATHGGPAHAAKWLHDHPDAVRALSEVASRSAGRISQMIAVAPGFVDGLIGMPPPGPDVPGFPSEPPWPHDTPSLARLALALGAPLGLLRPTDVRVRPSRGRVPAPANGPTDLSDLFARTDAQSDPRPGHIRIERVATGSGHAYIVEIPATQDWSPRAGSMPTDLTTNVTGMAARRSAMERAVADALARVPGLKRGDPIMLVGYSQGGITAAGLASDPAFRRKYSVKSIVSVGAPIADFPIPRDVRVLAVEHDRDVVPNLDGADNPDRTHWTTVTRRLPRTGDGAAGAHAAAKYARTIDMIRRSPPPAVAAWLAANAGFFGGGKSTSFDFTPTRVPAGSPGSPSLAAGAPSESGSDEPAGRRPTPRPRPYPGDRRASSR
ncbi:hypothetical protein [Spelaeicoccus albus]|uniref:Alpha/beta hydrolase family protein n=1 Tax=Spelaeicoccus albus TaxID=1280376 RepID=A0A7Z0AB38_9MICO|nr:hypothetical protein [Spelaeicoccus albus]NYI66388.1 hypothetical protein [Spelaeicoccus albus]